MCSNILLRTPQRETAALVGHRNDATTTPCHWQGHHLLSTSLTRSASRHHLPSQFSDLGWHFLHAPKNAFLTRLQLLATVFNHFPTLGQGKIQHLPHLKREKAFQNPKSANKEKIPSCKQRSSGLPSTPRKQKHNQSRSCRISTDSCSGRQAACPHWALQTKNSVLPSEKASPGSTPTLKHCSLRDYSPRWILLSGKGVCK